MKLIGITETAKIVRDILKDKFPATKFAVKSKKFSIYVKWMDGPTVNQVKAVVGNFHNAEFDSMTDLKVNHATIYKGEEVRFANDYISFDRSYSYEFLSHCAKEVAQKYNIKPAIVETDEHSDAAYIRDDGDFMPGKDKNYKNYNYCARSLTLGYAFTHSK